MVLTSANSADSIRTRNIVIRNPMNKSLRAIRDVKQISKDILTCCEEANPRDMLIYYKNLPSFTAIGGDGRVRSFIEFKKLCIEYYLTVDYQRFTANKVRFKLLSKDSVISYWNGRISVHFNNNTKWELKNYSITNVFKKIDGEWKIVHVHESSLRPQKLKTISGNI